MTIGIHLEFRQLHSDYLKERNGSPIINNIMLTLNNMKLPRDSQPMHQKYCASNSETSECKGRMEKMRENEKSERKRMKEKEKGRKRKKKEEKGRKRNKKEERERKKLSYL